MTNEFEKPKRRTFAPAYEWNKIEAYIENKYKVSFRDYKKGVSGHDTKHRDFWHWLIDNCYIRNESFFSLPEDYSGWWQTEIMEMIFTEFPELKTERIWVSW